MAATPYLTSNDLIASVKRKIMFPINNVTFSVLDILAFANEEMAISQVPSVMIYHQEYFVYKFLTPLRSNQGRYPIPDRSIGMKLRDLFWVDSNGNFFEMTRISSEDKAFFQRNIGANQAIHKFYLEGNDVVLTPSPINDPTGFLAFFIFLRPNQLVLNDRAAIIQNFSRTVTVDNTSLNPGDTFSIMVTDDFGNITQTDFTAVSGAPTGTEFQIGATSIITANNLSNAINASLIGTSNTGSPNTNIITILYDRLSDNFLTSNSSAFTIQTTQGIQFDNVASTWMNPVTNVVEPLFVNGASIDFLQTNPGHKIKAFDVYIPQNGITSNTINFTASDVPSDLIVGDYICLSNECIIPQIPPDLHSGLAERTAARILAAIGDQQGLATSQAKIQEIDNRQGTLIDSRVDGAPMKITARGSLLRFFKLGNRRRF